MSSAAIREVAKCLQRVLERNHSINAFSQTRPDPVVLDEVKNTSLCQNQANHVLKLSGLTFGLKDNICTHELRTTCSSRMLQDFAPGYNATVVTKLKECGAIILGKTNMDEFGMGSNSTFSYFGPTMNPLSSEMSIYSAGGSSGGSAAAVASNMCFGALGSDTGGSVRLPASYCGIIGFKPSYGLLSRRGLVAYANSFDTIGILCRDVQSTRLIFDCLKGFDGADPTSVDFDSTQGINPKVAHSCPSKLSDRRWRIGVPAEYNVSEISSHLKEAWVATLAALRDLGHQIIPVSLPSTKYAICSYYIIALAEAASNLAKYDGVRFGFHAKASPQHANNITLPLPNIAAVREMGFGGEVLRRILLGNYSLTSEAMENYFLQAQKTRRMVQNEFDNIFATPNRLRMLSKKQSVSSKGVDVLISPVSTSSAPTLEAVISPDELGLEGYINDTFTVPASMAGLPALSIRVCHHDGLPLGLQVIGQYGDESSLLDISSVIEEICRSEAIENE